MNLLDMRTIVFSYAISNFICMVVITLLWRRNRARFAGLGFWAADFILQFTALMLITLRGAVPDVLSMTVSNTMAVGGTILLYAGLERFTARRTPQFHNWILLAVFAAAHGYFAVVSPDLTARNILISSALLLVCLQGAWLMLRRSPPEMLRITKGVGYVLAAVLLISVARILIEVAVPSGEDLFSTNIYEKLFLLSYQMFFIVLTFSLNLMVNQRLSADLENDIAARQRTEEDLRLSEEKFCKAFRAGPDAVLLSRLGDGRFIEVNDSFTRLTGYPRGEALSRTAIDLGLWVDPREREKVIADLRADSRVRDYEFDVRTKTGAIRRVLYSGEIINIRDEECVLSIVHDISERKRIEREKEKLAEILNERVKELDCLYSISSIKEIPGLSLGERLERIVNVLPPALRYPGLAGAKVRIGANEAATGNWRETERKITAEVAVRETRIGEVEVGYLEAPDGAGEDPFLDQEKSLLQTVAARLGRFVAGQQAEEALRSSEERHRSIFEISPVGICLLGRDGTIESINPAGSAIFGYSAEDMPRLRNIVPEIGRADLDNLVKKIEENGPQIFESTGRKKNGTAFPLQVSAVLHRSSGGERLYLILANLTGQKQAAEAEHLRRLSKALIRFQEEERKHLARELHDHLGQDLATIKIGLALAKKDHPNLDPGLAGEIDEAIRTTDKLIADVRRISSGLRPESIDKIGLRPVLEEETRNLSSRSGVAIALDAAGLEERLSPALDIAVYRIVQEALTNVIKHAGARNARITIRRGESGIAVTIRDDGRGFLPDRTSKTEGLGLLGMRERASAEGGTLQIESSPGKGTTLFVNLPLRPGETDNRDTIQSVNHKQS